MKYILFCLLLFTAKACSNEKAAKPMTTAPTPETKAAETEMNNSATAGAQPTDVEVTPEIVKVTDAAPATTAEALPAVPETNNNNNDAENFTDVIALDPTIKLDVRYATANNFTKAQIYDCPACLLRPEAAQKVVKIHQALRKQGLGLKMFDCYRPRPYQQRLWNKVPNPDYVTPPAKGSMHSRGAAVDLTIVDAKGEELDMGTEYDFFGKEAHFDYTNHTAKVLENRRMLRRVMENNGFQGIRTEWWHFSFKGKDYPLSDYVWPCK